jgi:hypothetical protein
MTSRQEELNLFANCFSPEGERYQSFSPPDASKWYDISMRTFQGPCFKGSKIFLIQDTFKA